VAHNLSGQTTIFNYSARQRLVAIDYPTSTADVNFAYAGSGNRLTQSAVKPLGLSGRFKGRSHSRTRRENFPT
jgi:hypothetical protein